MALSELADWWDKQRRESEKILDEWVQENPQWWAIGIATATSTAMELGGGMVDALRFGEGMAKGDLKGAVQDGMRLLVVVGPAARATGWLGRLMQTQMIKLAVTTKGVTGPCTFTAVNNAATIVSSTAKNYFLTARQAAAALGKSLKGLAKEGKKYKLATWIDDLIPFLTKHGVKVKNLGTPKSISDVVAAANSNNGVIVFAIEWVDAAGKLHRHSMIAVRTHAGVRFADYGGKFIKDFSELASRGSNWQAVGGFRIAQIKDKGAAVLFEGMEVLGALDQYAGQVFKGGVLLLEGMQAVETSEDGVDLAFPVEPRAIIAKQTHEPEVIKQSFEAFKARKNGKTVIKLDPITIVGRPTHAPRPEYLTGVQYRLNAAGFGAGPVDGIFGPKTKRAVALFQKTHSMSVTGIPDPATQQKLAEVCGY